MLVRVLAIIMCLSVCVSVCVSVTRQYRIKTAKHGGTQTMPRDSPGTLVFWHHDFDHYPLIAHQPWELTKKVQLALNRKYVTLT